MGENSYTETTEITEAEQELLRQHASTILKDYYEYLRQREERKRLRSQKRLEVHEKKQ